MGKTTNLIKAHSGSSYGLIPGHSARCGHWKLKINITASFNTMNAIVDSELL